MKRKFSITFTGIIEDIGEDEWGKKYKKPYADSTLKRAVRNSFVFDRDPQIEQINTRAVDVTIEPRKIK